MSDTIDRDYRLAAGVVVTVDAVVWLVAEVLVRRPHAAAWLQILGFFPLVLVATVTGVVAFAGVALRRRSLIRGALFGAVVGIVLCPGQCLVDWLGHAEPAASSVVPARAR